MGFAFSTINNHALEAGKHNPKATTLPPKSQPSIAAEKEIFTLPFKTIIYIAHKNHNLC